MNRLRRFLWLIAMLAGVVFVSPAIAAVSVPSIFGDHMVLQRETAIPIWGWAKPGEAIAITLKASVGVAPQSAQVRADGQGQWRVTLEPIVTGPTYTLTIAGENTLMFTDVLAGEVWLCSGQSNMEWPLSRSEGAEQAVAEAEHPNIRLFLTPRRVAAHPALQSAGQWRGCTPDTAKSFSAAAYYFGVRLNEKLDVPIGLIESAWGGTRVESWTPREMFKNASSPQLQGVGQQLRHAEEKYRNDVAALLPMLRKWIEQSEQALRGDQPLPVQPSAPKPPIHHQNHATALYNGMIAAHAPFPIQGAIWYQGEANVGQAYDYRFFFSAMIQGWRKVWGREDMPIYFAQLAPFRYGRHDPQLCAELWDSQLHVLKNTPNVGMAVITDIANIRDIHPRNKRDVGFRLANWALAKTYRYDRIYSGPIYDSMMIEGNAIHLRFEHAEGLHSRDATALTHFTIAGADRQFVPAVATIEGDSILVRAETVTQPQAVRCGFTDTAQPNLVNAAGLPASPFRTDDWPLKTQRQ